jgi:hypothetical protein
MEEMKEKIKNTMEMREKKDKVYRKKRMVG